MAKTLREIEEEKGALTEIIPQLVNTLGQKEAAQQLGTSQSTISRWLKSNGYVAVTTWIKVNNKR